LTAETKNGGTVTNVKRAEESSRWWEQLQQNYENRSMCGHVGQPTNCYGSGSVWQINEYCIVG